MIDLIPTEREDLLAVVSLAASGLRALGDWEDRLATTRARGLTVPRYLDTARQTLAGALTAWHTRAQTRLREMGLALSAEVEELLSESRR